MNIFRWFLIMVSLLCVTGNAVAQEDQVTREVKEGNLVVSEYNLKVQIPEGWISLPSRDWHTIAALSSQRIPTLEDALITFHLVPMAEGYTLDSILLGTIRMKAIAFGQKDVGRINERLERVVAGEEAFLERYIFSIQGQSFLQAITLFQKGEIAYVAALWAPQAKGDDFFKIYDEWLGKGIAFLDPEKDLPPELVERLKEQEALQAPPPAAPQKTEDK